MVVRHFARMYANELYRYVSLGTMYSVLEIAHRGYLLRTRIQIDQGSFR